MPGEVGKLLDEPTFFEGLSRELDNLVQTEGFLDRSKALIFWFARHQLHLEDEDDIKTRISDGSNDEGIDGIFIDEDQRFIFIVSACTVDRFEHSRRTLPENVLQITFDGF